MFKKKFGYSSPKDLGDDPVYKAAKELLGVIRGMPANERFPRTGLRYMGPNGLGVISNPELLPRCVASDLLPDPAQPLEEPIRYTIYAHTDGQIHTGAEISFDRVSSLGERNSGIHKIIRYSIWQGGEGTESPNMPPLFVDKHISEYQVTLDGQNIDTDPDGVKKYLAALNAGLTAVSPEEATEVTAYLADYVDRAGLLRK